jgi:NifU-like protein involved in Fe-S cluster formation
VEVVRDSTFETQGCSYSIAALVTVLTAVTALQRLVMQLLSADCFLTMSTAVVAFA